MARPLSERLRLRTTALIHAFTYAAAVTVLVTVGAVVVGVVGFGSLIQTKLILFVAGWILMAYSVVRLWPTEPEEFVESDPQQLRNRRVGEDDPTGETIPAESLRTQFQQAVDMIPPARWVSHPRTKWRITTEGKLFLGSVLVLLVSFLMEFAFGVA